MAVLCRLERLCLVDLPLLSAKYLYLATLLPKDNRARCLEFLHDHAVVLTRQDALSALQGLHDDLPHLSPELARW